MTAQQPTAPWTPERALEMFRSWCDISVTHREHCERWDGFDNLDDFAQIAVGGLESATAEIERQRARADKAEAELQRVTLTGDTVASDASLYKGNSVRHWWDKCQAYTDAFRKRDKAEARADGLASQLAAAMAANDSLTAELAKAQQQPDEDIRDRLLGIYMRDGDPNERINVLCMIVRDIAQRIGVKL